MNTVDIRTLPLSSKTGLMWSFFWRGLLITIASSLAGALLGGVLGFIFGFLGFPIEAIQIVGGIAGLLVGCVFFYLYVQWLLTSRLGAYRLQLVRESDHA